LNLNSNSTSTASNLNFEISEKIRIIEAKTDIINNLKLELDTIKRKLLVLEKTANLSEEKSIDKNIEVVGWNFELVSDPITILKEIGAEIGYPLTHLQLLIVIL
jgi:hypothetical protein